MTMQTEMPRLVTLDLYRNSLKTVEKLSRQRGDKKVHAWVMKAIQEVSDLIIQVAKDEMVDIPDEEDSQKKLDEDFYG